MKRPGRRNAFLKAAVCATGLAWTTAHALDGRVVDAARAPLTGVKITLSPWSLSGETDGEGHFSLGATGLAPVLSARSHRDPSGKVRADGRRVRGEMPWARAFALPEGSAPGRAPLAKPAGLQSVLTAEKAGFAPARILLPENAVTVPDIILAPGPFEPALTGQSEAMPIFNAPNVSFDRGTSTDLPDFHPPVGGGGGSTLLRTLASLVVWRVQTRPGTTASIRAKTHFPAAPEAPADSMEGEADSAGYLVARIGERFSFATGKAVSADSQQAYGDDVTLILRNPAGPPGYATMKWLRFDGPIYGAIKIHALYPDAQHAFVTYTGPVPPLDTCGRLAGRIDWKGPGPRPELWIGMLGTDLFAKVDAEGGFLTTDLPPGILPLAVVALARDANGRAASRIFYNLNGISVSPGQTSLLDPLVLSAP